MPQKWSKGKLKEKSNNMVLFDTATYDKLLSEVPKYKMITLSVLSDRLRVRLARVGTCFTVFYQAGFLRGSEQLFTVRGRALFPRCRSTEAWRARRSASCWARASSRRSPRAGRRQSTRVPPRSRA